MPKVTRAMMSPETQHLRDHFAGLLDGSRRLAQFMDHVSTRPQAYEMSQVELALEAIPRNLRPFRNRHLLRPALVHMILDAVRRKWKPSDGERAVLDRYANAIAEKQAFRPASLLPDVSLRRMQVIEAESDAARKALIALPSFRRFMESAQLHHLLLKVAFEGRPRPNRAGRVMHESLSKFGNILRYIEGQASIARPASKASARASRRG